MCYMQRNKKKIKVISITKLYLKNSETKGQVKLKLILEEQLHIISFHFILIET